MGATCSAIKTGQIVRPVSTKGGNGLREKPAKKKQQIANFEKKSAKNAKKEIGKPSLPTIDLTEKDEPSIHHDGLQQTMISKNNIPSTTHEGLEDSHLHYTNPDHLNNTMDDLPLKNYSNYKKGPPIGKGSIGQVFECLNLHTGELVAVREIKLYGEIQKMQHYIKALQKETNEFRKLNHPNILRFYETIISEIDDSHFQIDMALEYVSGGSVKVLLDKFKGSEGLEEKVVRSYTRQVLEGLAYLHQMEIVHKNLKITNILIDASGTIKLSDFNSLRFERFSEENPQETNRISPSQKSFQYWLAPEVFLKKAQGKPSDIWSVGCLVLEMLTGTLPYKSLAQNNGDLLNLFISEVPPELPQHISEICQDFLFRIFKFNPDERPTVLELLTHPFVHGVFDGSPNNSYLESETIHSSVVGQSMDFFKNNSIQILNMKINGDLRSHNFSALSSSNLNVSRFVSREYAGELIQLKKINMSDVPSNQKNLLLQTPNSNNNNNNTSKNSFIRSPLIKVQEVSEDEHTPLPTDKQFFPLRPKHSSEQMFDEHQQSIKNKRHEIEQEMARELQGANSAELKEVLEQDEGDSKDYYVIKLNDDKGKTPEERPRLNIKPNSLFMGISFRDLQSSANRDENDGDIETPMSNLNGKIFEDQKSVSLNVFWTWENEKETAKALETSMIHNDDKQVLVVTDGFDENRLGDDKENIEPLHQSNRLVKPDLERMRKANKKKLEAGERQELEEIQDPNETQMVEVGEEEGGIYKKQTSIRFEGEGVGELRASNVFNIMDPPQDLARVYEDEEREDSPIKGHNYFQKL